MVRLFRNFFLREALEENSYMYLEFCEYPFQKRGGFFGKHLKKIPKCIRNLWISIPEKRRIFCEALEENCQVYLEFVNIYSAKEGGFFMKCLKKIPKCTRNFWISIPKKRRNIMYYYYIFSLRVGSRVFFSPLFVAITWRQWKKKRHVIHTKDFFFWKESPKFAKFWGKNNLKLSYIIGCGQNIASFQNV